MKTPKPVFFLFFAVSVGLAVILGASATKASPKPSGEAIDPALHMPPAVSAFVVKSCADCHTTHTDWPWYAKLPPASWLLQRDISRAQGSMNLTDWSRTSGKTKGAAIGTLFAACSGVQSGRMPLKDYLWMHPSSRPSKAEIDSFCGWTKQEIKNIKARANTAALTPGQAANQ